MPAPGDWPTLATLAREMGRTRETLVEAVTELRTVRRRLDALHASIVDHRRRLGHLERWRAWLAGGLAVLGLLSVGVLLPLAARLVGG
jgi:hypothetical protein